MKFKTMDTMDKKDKVKDSRPVYVPPRVILLDNANCGAGASCGAGSSPTFGTCIPTGNGATIQNCGRGNGAKAACQPGQGVK